MTKSDGIENYAVDDYDFDPIAVFLNAWAEELDEAREEVREGVNEEIEAKIVLNMAVQGVESEEICRMTGLSRETVDRHNRCESSGGNDFEERYISDALKATDRIEKDAVEDDRLSDVFTFRYAWAKEFEEALDEIRDEIREEVKHSIVQHMAGQGLESAAISKLTGLPLNSVAWYNRGVVSVFMDFWIRSTSDGYIRCIEGPADTSDSFGTKPVWVGLFSDKYLWAKEYEEGCEEVSEKVVLCMAGQGFESDEICRLTGLSRETVDRLRLN